MPPSRRPSVGADAAASPRDASPAGSAASRSRGARAPASRAARGGRARGRGRGRGASSSSSSSASAQARGAGAGRDAGSEGDADDDDAGYSRSPSSSAGGLPRALSPELGVPPVAPAFQRPARDLPRSSSLSLLSDDRSPSPTTPAPARPSSLAPDGPSTAADNGDDTFVASPMSTSTARAANTPARPSGARKASSGAPRAASTRAVDDSLSELDSSDDDKRAVVVARADSSDDEPLASTSTLPSSAPHAAAASAARAHSESQTPGPATSAPKRRGRPPGSKNKLPKAPVPRGQRAAGKADPPYRAPSGSEGTASPGAASARQRATRANVTLPPGYIEGVTSSRWPRAGGRKKRDGPDDEEDEEDREGEGDEPLEAKVEDVTGTTTPIESRASSVNALVDAHGDAAAAADDAVEAEEIKPSLPVPVDRKGKGRAVDGEDDDDVSMNGGEGTLGVSAPMSRETSVDERSVTPAIAATPTRGGKGKSKGKRGKKAQAVPEPVERAKRRKLDIPDKEAEARHAAREEARLKFLDQLDGELDQVEDRSHPLLDLAYRRLQEEKGERLERLRRYQEEREKELGVLLEKRIQASWRQWADNKDALRMKLYLENHASLKELVAEEKVFPFFRDHPLFVNNHDLPPTNYYRGPQRDPAFQPREILHAGHYVEPPPLNPALKHEAWQLAPEEIEADLALFYDIEDEPFYAPPPPAAVPPASAVFPYPHPHPPYYYNPLAAAPPGAPPYLGQAGYASAVPAPGAPYGLPAYYVPPPTGAPLSTSAAALPHPYAPSAYSYDPPTASTPAAPPAPATAPSREPAAPPPGPAALAPPVQPKVSPTLHKASTSTPALPVHAKPATAVNGGSARSPPLPPMQMQRPPSHGSSAPGAPNGQARSHEPHVQQQQHAAAPAPRSTQASQPHPHPYARQAESFQHSPSPYGQPQPHAQQQQPRQHTHHSHPPTFPSPQPPSPSRPREQRPQPPSYPGAPQTAAQRFSPSFGVQTKAPSAMGVGSKSPSLGHVGAPPHAHGPPQQQQQQQAPTSASLVPQRGTLFPSMPTPAPPTHPAHSPNGLAPPTLPSLSRKSTPSASSPPRPRPPSAASSSSQQQQQQQGGQSSAPVVERVLAPFWAAGSPPNGVGGTSRGLPPHQHQHHQHQHQHHGHSHSQQQVGPATGLPLPSWLKPLAQQVKLPHEVRREEEARAAKAAQAQAQGAVSGGGGGGAGAQAGAAGGQGRPAWAS
ncbi:hypothetical protein JCM3775_006314 [Rhodotorula graminis]|uniref:Uncharacterized protein n=1 Tax=Rhodotorula graminis (strain WP1) TaxID=578459 RepID=A0A194SBH8_RHOGW|nr:uncharacterized protein RHOBADRAFT_50596 [Rhodotorula graminis WP1]KPV78083.1 hypothetical protein RHOBADRAFT_50596 [Rhodotorula graminis WP1]